jgi:type II secretory pathway pseudopilin PulG
VAHVSLVESILTMVPSQQPGTSSDAQQQAVLPPQPMLQPQPHISPEQQLLLLSQYQQHHHQQQQQQQQQVLLAAYLQQQQQQQSLGPAQSLATGAAPANYQDPYQLLQVQPPLTTTTHNLIPPHLQQLLLAPNHAMNGTPGFPSALVPMTEERRDLTVVSPLPPECYNGVNLQYPGLSVLHAAPPIFTISNFLSPAECEFLISVAQDCFGPAPVVGKGSGEISASRTSSTCYLAREDVPDILRK